MGTWSVLPVERQGDGEFRDVAYPTDDGSLQMIQKAVIAEYEKITGVRIPQQAANMASYPEAGPCPACKLSRHVLCGLNAIHRFGLATPDEGIGVELRVFLLFYKSVLFPIWPISSGT